MIDAGSINLYNVAVSESWLVATWDLDGKVSAYRPANNSQEVGTLTMTNPGAVTASGDAIFLAYNPKAGTPMPGIYTWDGSNAPVLFESFATLGGDATLASLIRATAFHLLMSDGTNVRMIETSQPGPARMLFHNPGTRTIFDVRPSRPHAPDGEQGGVLVQLQDNMFLGSGRDYYVNTYVPDNAPTDLAAAVNKLADASACGAAAHYHGSGVLSLERYIYEGQSGLFMVDVDQNGAVSKLVRLTTLALAAPEVTGYGDLFAGRMNDSTGMWELYRVGNP
jgi:hypothetical protein